MDLDRVDPALRASTRRTRLPDVSRRWVRSLLRGGARVLPVPRILGVEVASIRVAGQRARVYRLFAPMIDDRTAADATLDEIDHPIWNNRFNRAGWNAYLGERASRARAWLRDVISTPA